MTAVKTSGLTNAEVRIEGGTLQKGWVQEGLSETAWQWHWDMGEKLKSNQLQSILTWRREDFSLWEGEPLRDEARNLIPEEDMENERSHEGREGEMQALCASQTGLRWHRRKVGAERQFPSGLLSNQINKRQIHWRKRTNLIITVWRLYMTVNAEVNGAKWRYLYPELWDGISRRPWGEKRCAHMSKTRYPIIRCLLCHEDNYSNP